MTCELCETQRTLRKIMEMIDDLPEINAALYDDAITDVYNAADQARHLLDHYQPCLSDGDNQLSPSETTKNAFVWGTCYQVADSPGCDCSTCTHIRKYQGRDPLETVFSAAHRMFGLEVKPGN